MDYSFFDGIIDCVFVVSTDKSVVYCNEPAATLCGTSVKRITKGKAVHEFIQFADANLFVMPNGTVGKDEPFPLTEMGYTNVKDPEKSGKVQIGIHPFKEPDGSSKWIIMIRDVTLEEVLHKKYHGQLEEKQVVIDQLKVAKEQLEDYSKNLEQKVEERTLEVKRANTMLNAIMNSLGQGFLVFDDGGTCGRIYTRACEDVLESVPEQKKIWDVLRFSNEDLDTFKMWMQAAFSESLPFEALRDLAPSSYKHTAGKHVRLEYYPLRDDQNKISNVVLVATDWTSEFEAQEALEKERKFARMVVRLVTNKPQFIKYLDSAQQTIRACRKHVADAINSKLDHEWLFRALHTLEGESGTFSVGLIWRAAREPQEILEPLKAGAQVDINALISNLSAALNKLEGAYNEFLKENESLFKVLGMGERKVEMTYQEVDALCDFLKKSGLRSEVIGEFKSEIFKEPVRLALTHYSEVVKQVSEKLNKPMNEIEWHGVDTKLYLPAYQDLFASFVHAFRNAVDHGMEPTAEREMVGKPKEGTIKVTCETFEHNQQKWHRFVIQDDGGGINADRLRQKLSQKHPDKDWANTPEHEVIQHVFDSGVSTKDDIGEFSGRGIGLNAVLANAAALGGKSWVESKIGQGTWLKVEVPDVNYNQFQKKSA